MPAAGEGYVYVHDNYQIINTAFTLLGISIPDTHYWSSTEYETQLAVSIPLGIDQMSAINKTNSALRTMCFLDISS